MRITVGVALLLANAATGAARPPVQTISYTTAPCFGACPVYRVTVSSNGEGVFEGQRFTAVKGVRRFRITPAQWTAFRQRLDIAHGHGKVDMSGPPLCKEMATDQAGVDVVWSGAQRPFTLHAYFGCDMDTNRALFTRLQRAPDALPIAGLIGKR